MFYLQNTIENVERLNDTYFTAVTLKQKIKSLK